jgi:hypothetical protein
MAKVKSRPSMAKQSKPPFDDIWAVVEYLNNEELRHYCDDLLIVREGVSDNHVYHHVHQIIRWMSQCPDACPKDAQELLAEVDGQIAEARAEARAAA